MYDGVYRAVDHELLVRINIHVSDRPVYFLAVYLADLVPVVRVFCVKQSYLSLARAIVQIAFVRKPPSVDTRV